MDAQMREIFLRELMILQSSPILSAEVKSPSSTQISDNSSDRLVHKDKEELQQKEASNNNQTNNNTSSSENTIAYETSQVVIETIQKSIEEGNDYLPLLLNNQEERKENIEINSVPSERNLRNNRQVDITLLTDLGLAGRTLSGLFVACDTNLTHTLLDGLKTPIGIQSNALLRFNDVISIEYC